MYKAGRKFKIIIVIEAQDPTILKIQTKDEGNGKRRSNNHYRDSMKRQTQQQANVFD